MVWYCLFYVILIVFQRAAIGLKSIETSISSKLQTHFKSSFMPAIIKWIDIKFKASQLYLFLLCWKASTFPADQRIVYA